MTQLKKILVTRHPALVAVIKSIVGEDIDVLSHATEEDVRGKHVYGVLPLRMAASAAMLTEVTLHLPPELRGVELTEEQVRQYMQEFRTYKVQSC